MNIIYIAIFGIIVVLIAIQFKNGKSEYGSYIAIAACVFIFFFVISKLSVIIDTINTIQSYISISQSYVSALIKIIGITYIAEFSSDICKDSGHSAIANQIQVFGKLSVLAVSMPIILALLETINSFLT